MIESVPACVPGRYPPGHPPSPDAFRPSRYPGKSLLMASAIANLFRLARAGFVCAQYGVRLVPKGHKVPLVLRIG